MPLLFGRAVTWPANELKRQLPSRRRGRRRWRLQQADPRARPTRTPQAASQVASYRVVRRSATSPPQLSVEFRRIMATRFHPVVDERHQAVQLGRCPPSRVPIRATRQAQVADHPLHGQAGRPGDLPEGLPLTAQFMHALVLLGSLSPPRLTDLLAWGRRRPRRGRLGRRVGRRRQLLRRDCGGNADHCGLAGGERRNGGFNG